MAAARLDRCTLVILGGYGLLAYLVLPWFWTHYEHQRGLAEITDGDADRRRVFPAIP